MVTGIGIDTVDVSRIKKLIDRWGDKFTQRILTTNEYIQYNKVNDKANFVAKKFAIKEAYSKAIGTGITFGLNLKDIDTGHDYRGKPFLINKHGTHISVTDEKNLVTAVVIVEK